MSGCILCGNPAIPGIQKPQNSCQLSNGHPCSPCRQMKKLEAEIYETKNALESLVERHRKLQSESNHSHIPLVLHVPEIASTIFQLCLPDRLPHVTVDTDRTELAAPLTLGAVCRSWRQIAWSTPRLWNCVSIELSLLKLPARSIQVQQWLARSGQLPLSIYIDTDGDDDVPPDCDPEAIFGQFFDIINGYSSRWYYLNLNIPAWMISRFVGDSRGVSILHTLILEAQDQETIRQFGMIGIVPAPIDVQLYDFRLKSVDIEWNNVTHVEVTLFHVDECIELIRRTSKLVQCKLGNVLPLGHHFTIPTNPVVIPQLQILDLGTHHQDVNLFFNHITLPSLQHFALYMGSERLPSENLGLLFRRSSCSLRVLVLYKTTFDDIQFNELLRTTPSLRKLELEDVWPPYEPDSLFRLLATASRISRDDRYPSEPFLPELQSIQFIPIGPISWNLVPAIFGPLSDIGEPHQRPLQELGIFVHPQSPYIDRDTIHRLLELIDAGISLSLQFEISGYLIDFLQQSMKHHGITKEGDSSSSPAISFQRIYVRI